jgi:hypothetical protein
MINTAPKRNAVRVNAERRREFDDTQIPDKEACVVSVRGFELQV